METANDQLVAVRGDSILVMRPKTLMSKEEALRHAAWIVSIVGDDEAWEETLKAVQNT